MSPPDDSADAAPERRTFARAILPLLGLLSLLAVVLVIWRLLPEGWTSASRLAQMLRSLRQAELGFLYVCAAYALMASAFVPITGLIAATALVFEPARAFGYAFTGSLLAAALSYGIGRVTSARVLRYMRGPRLNKLRDRLHAHAFKATVVARLLPVGNFNAINLFAGALAVPFGPFMLGNAVGLICGIGALTLMADRLASTLASPTPQNVGVLLLLAAAAVAVSLALSWLIERPRRQ